jgi:O-antigen ligase
MPARAIEPFSWRLAALIALGTCLMAVSPVIGTVMLGACVLATLLGPAWALRALALATLICYANPHIIKLSPVASVLLRVVLVVAILRILPLVRGSDLRLVWPIWLLGLLSALTSVVTSPALEISIMKVITFTLAATTVIVAFGRVKGQRLARLESWFVTLGTTVTVLSGLTLLKPGLGIGSDGGLQGLLGQPQALGIFMAPFAAWALAGVLLMRRGASRLELWFALGSVVLIVLTRARTAAFATALALAVVMASRALDRRRAGQASLGRPALLVSIAALAILGLAVTSGAVSRLATGFAFKDYDATHRSLGGAFYDSRGGGILSEWRDFEKSPVLGNGFGVYPDGKFPVPVVRFAGIPISAPIEKGFLPTAILQEGGLVGAASLTLLIVWLGRRAWRAPDLRWRAMFVACLAVNVGECVFLSPGGIGLLDWLLIGVAISACRLPGVTAPARELTRLEAQPPAQPARVAGVSLPAVPS